MRCAKMKMKWSTVASPGCQWREHYFRFNDNELKSLKRINARKSIFAPNFDSFCAPLCPSRTHRITYDYPRDSLASYSRTWIAIKCLYRIRRIRTEHMAKRTRSGIILWRQFQKKQRLNFFPLFFERLKEEYAPIGGRWTRAKRAMLENFW